jgi:hypothetical protein
MNEKERKKERKKERQAARDDEEGSKNKHTFTSTIIPLHIHSVVTWSILSLSRKQTVRQS